MSPIVMEVLSAQIVEAAAEPISPDELTDLLLWLDATTDVFEDAAATDTAEDTEEVEQWNDQSGNAYHCTNVNGGGGLAELGPTFDANGMNGEPTIDFASAGSGQGISYLAGDIATAASSTFSMFMVCRMDDATEEDGRVVSVMSVGQAADWQNIYSFAISRKGNSGGLYRFDFNAQDEINIDSGGEGVNVRIGVVINGTAISGYLNGVEVDSGTLNATPDLGGPASDVVRFILGANSHNYAEHFDGGISEVVFTLSALSEAEIAGLDLYFVDKWGF